MVRSARERPGLMSRTGVSSSQLDGLVGVIGGDGGWGISGRCLGSLPVLTFVARGAVDCEEGGELVLAGAWEGGPFS